MTTRGDRPVWANVSPGRGGDGNLLALFRDEALSAGWLPRDAVDGLLVEVGRLGDEWGDAHDAICTRASLCSAHRPGYWAPLLAEHVRAERVNSAVSAYADGLEQSGLRSVAEGLRAILNTTPEPNKAAPTAGSNEGESDDEESA